MIQPVTDLHIITALTVGGAETVLARHLEQSSRRHCSAVLSLSATMPLRDRIEAAGIPVHTASMPPGRPTPASVWRFVRLVRALRPRAVSGWMYHGALAAVLARQVTPGRPPMAWQIRQSLHDVSAEKRHVRMTLGLLARLSRQPDAIVYNSLTARGHHEALGFHPDRGLHLPNGIDIARFRPDAEARQAVRAELAVPDDALIVGQVARLHPHKDHETALRAVAALVARVPAVHYVAVGGGPADREAALRRMAGDLGIEGRVHILGARTDVARLTAAFDVAVNTSFTVEAFPNCVAEAMAAGCPVVATDVGDSRAILDDAEAIVTPRDPDALARALATRLRASAADRAALGATYRQRIEDHYPLARMTRRFDHLMASLSGTAATAATADTP